MPGTDGFPRREGGQQFRRRNSGPSLPLQIYHHKNGGKIERGKGGAYYVRNLNWRITYSLAGGIIRRADID